MFLFWQHQTHKKAYSSSYLGNSGSITSPLLTLPLSIDYQVVYFYQAILISTQASNRLLVNGFYFIIGYITWSGNISAQHAIRKEPVFYEKYVSRSLFMNSASAILKTSCVHSMGVGVVWWNYDTKIRRV